MKYLKIFTLLLLLSLTLTQFVKAEDQREIIKREIIKDNNNENEVEIFPAGSGEQYIYFQYGSDRNFPTSHFSGYYGFGYYLKDGLSFNGEIGGIYISQSDYKGMDTGGINSNLIFRWHFIKEDKFSIYVDGGAGILLTTERVPDNGTRVNFTSQLGIGGTIKISDNNRIMIGARYFHSSNLNNENNPGRDTIMEYCGLTWPW